MQENVVKLEISPRFTIGRESEDMCLLAKFFNGFANSTRLSILLLLAERGEMRVGDLVNELDAPQPRISDHLGCLAHCGYVQARRDGRRAYYSITDDRVLEMLSLGESLLRDNLEHVEACDEIKKDL
ncbi:metalloregulator ArsR/SmtB family transcription factor [soil metagenome]